MFGTAKARHRGVVHALGSLVSGRDDADTEPRRHGAAVPYARDPRPADRVGRLRSSRRHRCPARIRAKGERHAPRRNRGLERPAAGGALPRGGARGPRAPAPRDRDPRRVRRRLSPAPAALIERRRGNPRRRRGDAAADHRDGGRAQAQRPGQDLRRQRPGSAQGRALPRPAGQPVARRSGSQRPGLGGSHRRPPPSFRSHRFFYRPARRLPSADGRAAPTVGRWQRRPPGGARKRRGGGGRLGSDRAPRPVGARARPWSRCTSSRCSRSRFAGGSRTRCPSPWQACSSSTGSSSLRPTRSICGTARTGSFSFSISWSRS